MGVFVNLDDSPMFMKQVSSIEQTCDQVKDRCQMLYKGCKKFMAVLGESSNGYQAFADCLEEFGGGRDDPVSVSVGGPVMSKFITALRELAIYKELLRSQVEHTLYDRLTQFLTVDMQEAKESHGRFDKAVRTYDQAREKFVSLKKNTREDIVEGLEENLLNSKSAFERSRFHLVKTLMNVEAKKKYEFLESMSAMMDAHLRFFKLGYDLLMQMEPYVDQVLTYAQQSREQANVEQDKLEKRIQEFRTQAELSNFEPSSEREPSTGVDGVKNVVCKSSYSSIEAMMQAATCGEVKTIKQGYLLKRSSNMRGDWKRRFFVLDSQGTLYYYRSNGAKPMGFISHQSSSSFDQSGSMFSRFRTRHNRSSSLNEETIGCHTVDLQTSTIKIDAEDTDLRLCFRIISPVKTYTLQAQRIFDLTRVFMRLDLDSIKKTWLSESLIFLVFCSKRHPDLAGIIQQAENGADRMDWVNKITAVITSLLNTNFLQQTQPKTKGLGNSSCFNDYEPLDTYENPENAVNVDQGVSVSKTLREVPGNELCAECSCPEPDWASLNLGILLCIECSGVHRNLGVHISKVRSLSLDVKVWEPTIMDLFRSLGNTYCNSVWEGLLLLEKDSIESMDEVNPIFASVTKPCPQDTFYCKEKYIHAKYVEKSLVIRETARSGNAPTTNIWEAVKSNNLRQVYRLIVTSDVNIVNTIFDDVVGVDLYHHVDAQDSKLERKATSPATCRRIKDRNESESCLQGCSLLHLACHYGHKVMVELLLQFGADTNKLDYHGRTPLHHCIFRGNNELAKFLIKRGARASIKDAGGVTALERAMEMGAITDEKLFILLTDS